MFNPVYAQFRSYSKSHNPRNVWDDMRVQVPEGVVEIVGDYNQKENHYFESFEGVLEEGYKRWGWEEMEKKERKVKKFFIVPVHVTWNKRLLFMFLYTIDFSSTVWLETSSVRSACPCWLFTATFKVITLKKRSKEWIPNVKSEQFRKSVEKEKATHRHKWML